MSAEKKQRPLNADEVSFYNDNGYLVLERFFPPAECDALLELFEKYADEDHSAILNLDRTVPAVRNVMKDPRIVSALEQLQQAEIVGLMSQVLFKRAGSRYAAQAWNPHQDNSYPQAKPGAYITINVFLEDSDRENGCMYIYPGSHRDGLLNFDPIISYRERLGNNPGNMVTVPPQFRKVDLKVGKGGMLVLHGCCIHGSYPNKSANRSRPLYSISYITKGESFIPGNNANRMAIELR